MPHTYIYPCVTWMAHGTPLRHWSFVNTCTRNRKSNWRKCAHRKGSPHWVFTGPEYTLVEGSETYTKWIMDALATRYLFFEAPATSGFPGAPRVSSIHANGALAQVPASPSAFSKVLFGQWAEKARLPHCRPSAIIRERMIEIFVSLRTPQSSGARRMKEQIFETVRTSRGPSKPEEYG